MDFIGEVVYFDHTTTSGISETVNYAFYCLLWQWQALEDVEWLSLKNFREKVNVNTHLSEIEVVYRNFPLSLELLCNEDEKLIFCLIN